MNAINSHSEHTGNQGLVTAIGLTSGLICLVTLMTTTLAYFLG